MLTIIEGIYENGQITLDKIPRYKEKVKVKVEFFDLENKPSSLGTREFGSLKRLGDKLGKKFSIPDDFNEPLEDLKDYM